MFLYIFDAQYLLSYTAIIVFIIVFSHSDYCKQNITPSFKEFFFGEDAIHDLLKKRNKIKKYEEISYQKLVKYLRDDHREDDLLK